MARFAYKAFDRAGGVVSGDLIAADQNAALDALSARSLTPFEVSETSEVVLDDDTPWWNRDLFRLSSEHPPEALQSFFFSLSTMLKAELTLVEALRATIEDIKDRRLRALIRASIDEVENGARLSDALAYPGSAFPERFISLVEIGEEANRLAHTASRASEMLEREIAFSRELKAALTYPAILLAASLIVIAGLIFFLAPTLAPVFAAVRVDPPFTIDVMLSLRDFLTRHWIAVAVSTLLAVVGVRAGVRRAPATVETALLGAPGIGPILKSQETAQLMLTLSLMLESGAGLLPSIQAAKETCRFSAFRELLGKAEDRVRAGGTLSESIGASALLSPEAQRMIQLGERSNRLPELAKSAAEVLDERQRRALQSFIRLLTPAITIIVGGLIGILIFSTLSAILEINALAT